MSSLSYMRGDKQISLKKARYGCPFELMPERFFAVCCPDCGRWRAFKTKNVLAARFKCFQCNKTTKLKSKKFYGLAVRYREMRNYTEAVESVEMLNGNQKN